METNRSGRGGLACKGTKRMKRIRSMTLGLILFSILIGGISSGEAYATSPPKDIQYNWAKDAIIYLIEEGILNGYPNGKFMPENKITRAEFSKIVAKAFAIRPTGRSQFKDIDKNWAKAYIIALAEHGIVKGFPDGTFRPNKEITRAELVAMLMRVVKLDDKMLIQNISTPSFMDVDTKNWAFPYVETAQRLGVVPVHFGVMFEPDTPATRAETAWMVKSLMDLKILDGKMVRFDEAAGTIVIKRQTGLEEPIQIGSDTLVFRNNALTDPSKLLRGDDVSVIATAFGEPKLIRAQGVVTKDDVFNKVSTLTKGTLTPEQVDALSKGEWRTVSKELMPSLKERLVKYGMTEEEADSILAQDWNTLGQLAKERVAQAVSEQLGISQDLTLALLDQNWKQARTYAEIEAAQYVLTKFLNM